MEQVRLGTSGLKVSRICLGMMSYGDPAIRKWALDEEAAEPIVRRAADAGVTFFDTADVYSQGVSEEITGRLLPRLFTRRDDYVLATKVWGAMGEGPNDRGLSRKHILAAVAAERGLPPAQVALAWLLGKPVVTLSEDEVARLEAPYRPHPVLGHS